MKIFLKKNWAKQITSQDNGDFFCGRQEEVDNLKSYLLNNDSGSVLLSGLRGVGKTTFIYKVLNDLKSTLKGNKKLVPVLINANRINIDDDWDIIKTIIRRLYSSVNKCDDNVDIGKLYKKAQCYYLLTEHHETKSTDEESISEKSETKEYKFDWYKFILFATFVVGVFLSSINCYIISPIGKIILLLSGFIAISPVIKTKKISLMNEKGAKELYQTDNSKENLESELYSYISKASEKNKIIFVIDEIDKLEQGKQIEIIKKFKNLFTMSCANYIFITDQKLYRDIVDKKREENIESTFFTHLVFLPDVSYSDLKKYIENITEFIELNGSRINSKEQIFLESEYKLLVDYLLFISNFDFYDLKKNIHGICKYHNDQTPYIDSESIYEMDSRITIYEKAMLAQIIGGVLNVYNYHAILKLNENQKSSDAIFNFFRENFHANILSYDKGKKSISVSKQSQPQNFQDTEDMHLYAIFETMLRYGLLDSSGPNNNKLPYLIWRQEISPYEVVNMHELLPEEKVFTENFNLFVKTINQIDSLYLKDESLMNQNIIKNDNSSKITGVNGVNIYADCSQNYCKLKKKIPEHILFDKLKQQKEYIIASLSTLNANVLQIGANILAKFIDISGINCSTIANNASVFSSIPSLRKTFSNKKHFTLCAPDLSKQILVVKDIDIKNELEPESLKLLKDQEKTIFICNIITDDKLRNQKLDYKYNKKQDNGKEKTFKGEVKDNYFEIVFNNDFMVFKTAAAEINKVIS